MLKHLKWDFKKATGTLYPIPKSKYYVIATDFYNSGFGYAYKKINAIVVNVDSVEEAQIMKKYMEDLPTLNNVVILNQLPEDSDDFLYTLRNEWKKKVRL